MPTAADPVEELRARAALSPLAWLAMRSPGTAAEAFADFHEDLTALPAPGEQQLRAVFRSAAKTTLVAAMAVWAVDTGQVRSVLIIRSNGSYCRDSRDEIEDLAHRAGLPVEVRHTDDLVVIDATRPDGSALRVPIWTKAPGKATRGIGYRNNYGERIRPELIIVDDVEDDDSARSATETDRIERYVTKVVIPTADTKHPGRVIVLGTPLSPTSMVAKMMRQEAPFDEATGWSPPMVVRYTSEREGRGVPAWPDMFNPNLFERTADDVYATEYDLEPLPSGSLVFPPARTNWVRLADFPRLTYRIGVDPATGEIDTKGRSDRTGIVAAGLHAGGLWVPAAICWEGDGDETPGKVVELIDQLAKAGHVCDGVAVEAVGGFRFVARRVAELVHPIPTAHGTPKDSKLVRAQDLNRWHKVDAVTFAEELRGTPLDVEFHTWNRRGQTVTGHDDMPDGLIWAGRAATDGWSVQPPQPAAA